MACTKAVIPVAGFGTRRLPLTKAIEKCMIPVGNRPIIDYIVQDCIAAGITDIIFVVGESFEQLKQYYEPNLPLEKHLAQKGKTAELQAIQELGQGVRFHYVVQDSYQPYGTSVAVHVARDLIGADEQFAVICGDQFYYHQDGSSELDHLLQRMAAAGTRSAMLGVEVPLEETPNYGIIAGSPDSSNADIVRYDHIVEKPTTPAEAPSTLNNGSFYVLSADVLPYIAANVEREMPGEHQITDALNDYAKAGHALHVFTASGEYLDCGTVDGWLAANNRVIGA